MLHRFPTGVSGEKVHQKRLPPGAPPWVKTVRVHFPRYNRTPTSCASPSWRSVIWAVQMSTVEFHPWNSRRADTEKPDEWRIDLDPMPRCDFATVRRVAHVAHEVLDELGAVGWPKTSGGAVCTSTSGSSRHRGSPTCDAPRSPSRVRSSDGRPEDVTTTWWRKDRDPTGRSSTTTRTREITPSPAPIRSAVSPTPGCRPDRVGRGRRRRPQDLTIARCPPVRRAGRPARGYRRGGLLDRAVAGVGGAATNVVAPTYRRSRSRLPDRLPDCLGLTRRPLPAHSG